MMAHISVPISDLAKSYIFYTKVLHTLQLKPVLGSVEDGFYGFGEREEPVTFTPET